MISAGQRKYFRRRYGWFTGWLIIIALNAAESKMARQPEMLAPVAGCAIYDFAEEKRLRRDAAETYSRDNL